MCVSDDCVCVGESANVICVLVRECVCINQVFFLCVSVCLSSVFCVLVRV